MKLKFIVALIAVALAAFPMQPIFAAQEEGTAATISQTETRSKGAENLVISMTKYMNSLPELYVCGEINYDTVYKENNKIQYAAVFDYYVKRPGQFQFNANGDIQNKQVVFDGKTVTVYDANKNVYGMIEAPSTIDGTLDLALNEYGISLPILDLARSEFGENIIKNVKKSAYVGLSDVGGIACHHVALAKENLSIQLWIEVGEKPVPRKVLITSKNNPAMPNWSYVITDWTSTPKLYDGWTTFVPKPGMKKIDFLKTADRPASVAIYGKES